MDWREHIERRADILGGEPVIRGARVPVRVLVGGLGRGMMIEPVCASYRVSVEQVRAALRHAADAAGEPRPFVTDLSR